MVSTFASHCSKVPILEVHDPAAMPEDAKSAVVIAKPSRLFVQRLLEAQEEGFVFSEHPGDERT